MYIPPHFKEVNSAEISTIISNAPLACIVANTDDGLLANHIPLYLDKNGSLIGHVALANDMHRVIRDGQEVLVMFRGEDGYISPNFYPSKAEHHKAVPTWNYQVVHMHGHIFFQHDINSKRAVVGLLTREHERKTNGENAWRMADAPTNYMLQMLDAIVAFRIDVQKTLAKSKLSQNREEKDYLGAVEGLRKTGSHAMAQNMERYFSKE